MIDEIARRSGLPFRSFWRGDGQDGVAAVGKQANRKITTLIYRRHGSPSKRGHSGMRELIDGETPDERGEIVRRSSPYQVVDPEHL